MLNPNRSEVWLIDLGLVAKVRPCLILSIPALDQDRALVTIAPHTTSVRGSRFEVAIKLPWLKAGAFDAQSLATIPHAKLIRRLGRLSEEQMHMVEDALCDWLGL